MPCIILELEEGEEDMAPNLRVVSRRGNVRLSESLLVAPSPAKRILLENSREKLVLNDSMVQVPPTNVARSRQELDVSSFVEKDSCLMQEITFVGQTLGEDMNDKDAPVSSSTPSQEEITVLLRQVPCFTALEPPSTNVDDFLFTCLVTPL